MSPLEPIVRGLDAFKRSLGESSHRWFDAVASRGATMVDRVHERLAPKWSGMVEALSWRWMLLRVRTIDPLVERVSARTARALNAWADRLSSSAVSLHERLEPHLRRASDWLEERARQAAERSRLVADCWSEWRTMRVEPALRHVEERTSNIAVRLARTAGAPGPVWPAWLGMRELATLVAAGLVIALSVRMTRPAPSPRASEDEIAQARSFVRPAASVPVVAPSSSPFVKHRRPRRRSVRLSALSGDARSKTSRFAALIDRQAD